MSKGIVIHHGSMPLKARLMVEEFIRKGYAKICFATSTLAQGINMPFDVVWIDNFNRMTPIVLKNLIGRAGRTTKAKGVFDYGYTIIKNENIDTFTTRFKEIIKLNETSRLDLDIHEINIDQQDLADSIKNETFNIELHLPESQIDRIKKSTINNEIKFILDNILKGSDIITGAQYYELPDPDRDKIKTCFKRIYSIHLKRSKLEKAEAAVLSAAIPIMLWHIQGRSFSEIVSLRYSFLSHKDQQRKIINRLKNKEINQDTANEELSNLTVRYSPIAAKIPDISLKASPLFSKSTPVTELSYDILI
ncbi:helicase-related protein [Morganella sp. GD04133]|uniref:helicase-related protein n=1 Tax=Morganella sp. GD04133 TaxID=2975435 RepID=UPI00244B5FB7|nr:helicase-related protein [Morganella sp. GD04133]MDH0355082.1 helicase-related protein [Morganella sp. GD04133]